jgi:hypothetical protein
MKSEGKLTSSDVLPIPPTRRQSGSNGADPIRKFLCQLLSRHSFGADGLMNVELTE